MSILYKMVFSTCVFIYLGCKSLPEKQDLNIQKSDSISVSNTYSKFQQYLLDTSLNFENWETANTYVKSKQSNLNSAKIFNGKMLNVDETDSAFNLKKEFDISMGHFHFRQIKILPKTNFSMMLVGAISPFAKEITYAKKLALYNTFPLKIRNNDIGKKALKELNRYKDDNNLGKEINSFGILKLHDLENRRILLGDLINNDKQYTLLVFGASWCKPCLVQERSLNRAAIDSSKIKIIGLSVDSYKEKFASYIKHESFFWSAYRLEGGMDNPFIKFLNFNSIPRNFLLDKNCRVIKEDLDVFEVLKAAGN